MFSFCSFFSGSSGNCTYVESEKGAILIDAGVSMKRIFEEISNIDRTPSKIKALFVTHEHSDHVMSVGAIARKLHIPVFATKPTWRAMYKGIGKIDRDLIKGIEVEEDIFVGDMKVSAFNIPHDAAMPVGYKIENGGKKFVIATDIGEMSEKLFLEFSGADAILLESNHDREMLKCGSYPYSLKERIRGKCGHLSNEEAALTCERLVSIGTRKILLGHLSGENNTPEIAFSEAEKCIERSGVKVGGDVFLSVAGYGERELINI